MSWKWLYSSFKLLKISNLDSCLKYKYLKYNSGILKELMHHYRKLKYGNPQESWCISFSYIIHFLNVGHKLCLIFFNVHHFLELLRVICRHVLHIKGNKLALTLSDNVGSVFQRDSKHWLHTMCHILYYIHASLRPHSLPLQSALC